MLHLRAYTFIHFYGLRWQGGDDIMGKAFTWRFGSDSIESRKFLMFVKDKATVNVSWVCFSSPLLYIMEVVYMHIGVRLLVARFDEQGNARA